jgi:hypothetical protein
MACAHIFRGTFLKMESFNRAAFVNLNMKFNSRIIRLRMYTELFIPLLVRKEQVQVPCAVPPNLNESTA